MPDDVLARGLVVWTQLFGTISFELFGHLHNVIHDYDAFFDHEMRRAGQHLHRSRETRAQFWSRSSGGRKS